MKHKTFHTRIIKYLLLKALCFRSYQVFLLGFVICSSTNGLQNIPIDESDAERMLQEGSLDSLTWQNLKQYYVQPLSVPHGELSILAEIFPELYGNIPVIAEDLSLYEPWDKIQIEKFFSRYPFLSYFKPILCFYTPAKNKSGRAGFFYHGPFKVSSAQLALEPAETFKFQGRVNFTDEVARWSRRTVTFSPVHWLHLQAGNFAASSDRGLFTGYFPSCDSNSRKVSENWLYGDYASWNGAEVTVKNRRLKSSANIFYHKSLLETIFGAGAEFQAGKIKYRLGSAHMSLPENDKAYNYLHTAITLKHKNLVLDLLTGIDPERPRSLPFILQAAERTANGNIEFLSVFLPAGLLAPRSFYMQKIAKETATELSGNSLLANLHLLRRLSEMFTLSTQIEGLFKGNKPGKLKGLFALTGSSERISFGLSCSRIEEIEEQNQSCVVEGNAMLKGKIEPETVLRFTLVNNNPVYACRGSLLFDIFPRISLTPTISIKKQPGEKVESLFGIKQVLTLFDRTCAEILFEKNNWSATPKEQINVEAKVWFLF
ncbi:MAG: hypothetical protein GX556_05265 [Fibrobacter sp.]|nr:hypothetical protein [Fibrobacter sp.]